VYNSILFLIFWTFVPLLLPNKGFQLYTCCAQGLGPYSFSNEIELLIKNNA
jgi:hypothetical protein